MTIYNLNKGANYDTDGQILKDWINSNKENITNLIIRDNGVATIEDMSEMFVDTSIVNLDLSSFNTANVTNMRKAFNACQNLTTISNFNASNVTNMSWMFNGYNSLVSIPNFDTSNVTNTVSMFANCNKLATVPDFNTSNVTGMAWMFSNCNNLSNASIQNIVNMCLNSNVTNAVFMNLSNVNLWSPLRSTVFDSSYYSNRLTDLTNAGWSY